MRRPALFLLLALLAGCARTAGSTRARAHAGSDARVLPGAPARFTATCEGCAGPAHYHWTLAVGPQQGCTLTGADGAALSVQCAAEGAWVLRLDVTDNRGAGLPDYANLLVTAAPPDAGGLDAGGADAGALDAGPVDAGPLDAGPVDAGPIDAGPIDAGPIDAGPIDAGPVDAGPVDAGPVDAGPLDGTVTVTFPDGTPAQDVIPGDLLELHAAPNTFLATCTWDPAPQGTQYLAGTSTCDTAIAFLAPASNVTFGVTLTSGLDSVHLASGPVTAHGAQHQTSSYFGASSIALDPVTGQIIEARPNHGTFLYTPGQGPDFWSGTSDGVACAGGGVREVAWPGGDLGRVFSDGGRVTTGTNAGSFQDCAEAPGFDGTRYQPILVATDGAELAAWDLAGDLGEDSSFSVDALANVEDPTGDGTRSAGLLTLTNGDTVQFVSWGGLRDLAQHQTAITPQTVPTTLTGLTRAVTGPANGGTAWLADDQGTLTAFEGTLLTPFFGLGVPTAQLSGAAPVTGLALEHAAPYAQDLWIAANGGVERVTAAPNGVGALPTLLRLDVGLSSVTVNGVAVAEENGAHALYFATSSGLYRLAP